MALKRWMYRGGRPNKLAKIQNRLWAILHSLGIFPERFVTLEGLGRKSGKTISSPLAMTVMNGDRYLVDARKSVGNGRFLIGNDWIAAPMQVATSSTPYP
jgi:hypothetical protein